MAKKIVALALAAALLVGPAIARPVEQDLKPGSIVTLISRCAPLARESHRTGDGSRMDAFIDRLLRDKRRNRDEIIACGAYLAGVLDAANYPRGD